MPKPPPPRPFSTISVNATSDFTATFNDKERISWKAPSFVERKGFIATSLGPAAGVANLNAPDWRDTALVSSSHRMDYSFEHAPTAWFPQAGDWKATHRWACVPKWSFFAGRGTPSPAEVDNGNAVLWNLRKISGDFDLEIFAAPLEGTPQRAHFTYPLNLNLSFAVDGSNLDSGYTFINGIYDMPSRLFLHDKQLATNQDRVIPTLRLQENAWYNRVTRVWQHFRIQRRNGRILVDSASNGDHAEYLPLKRVFDQPDSLDAAKPSQFAVWAWGGNGLAIARATLSFQNSPGGALPPADVPRSKVIKGDSKTEPESYTRVHNPISGGQFVTVLHDTPFELNKLNHLEMLVRPAKNTHLSLFATINGNAFETIINGPKITRDYACLLEDTVTPAEGMPGWLKLDVLMDSHKLSNYFRPDEPLVCTSIAIASPYDTVEEIAGLGVNPRGATLDYTPIKLSFSRIMYKMAPPRSIIANAHGRRLMVDFEDDMGEFQRFGGHDGAALIRVLRPLKQPVGLPDKVLRLLNQNIGGTAGATITATPFNLTAFPKIGFDYAIPQGYELNLIAVTDSGCFEIKLTGADHTWPIVGDAKVTQDGQWHHTEIDLEAMLKPRLKEPFVIRKLIFADSNRMSTYQRLAFFIDNFQFIPRLANGDKISFTNDGTNDKDMALAVCCDKSPNTAPDIKTAVAANEVPLAIPADGATWLHIIRTSNGKPYLTKHLRIETAAAPVKNDVPAQQKATVALQPPLISYIPSDRLVRDTFELPAGMSENAEVMGGFEIRRQAWAIRNTDTAATGTACGELVNLNPGDFCSIFFRKAAWDVNRWPCFSFNYRFRQSGCALVLSLLVNDAMTIVEWTGKDRHGSYFTEGLVGKTNEYAIQDGQWHESVCDLRSQLLKTRFAKSIPPTGITATELSTWATNHHGGGYSNPADARVYIDNFTIYSNHGKNPAFEWQQRVTDAGYAVIFDQKPDTIPEEKVTQKESRSEYKDVAPGTWFIHVRTQDKSGAWSAAAHKRIIIEK
ncbi:MAG: hypothetical protein J6X55_15175 [Victivallales bacterium]|nr:hypothetical protein [Victivallales bacterium]